MVYMLENTSSELMEFEIPRVHLMLNMLGATIIVNTEFLNYLMKSILVNYYWILL